MDKLFAPHKLLGSPLKPVEAARALAVLSFDAYLNASNDLAELFLADAQRAYNEWVALGGEADLN